MKSIKHIKGIIMKHLKIATLGTAALLCLSVFIFGSDKLAVASNANDAFITKLTAGSQIGLGDEIEVDSKGYPTLNSFDTLYNEMDRQGAVLVYLQSIPAH